MNGKVRGQVRDEIRDKVRNPVRLGLQRRPGAVASCSNIVRMETISRLHFQDTACTTIDETKCEKVFRREPISYSCHMDDDDDVDVKVYEDKCSVTYETAYEEQCRTEQEQVSQDDNGDGDDDCHRHDRLVCPADDGLGHEDSDNGDDDIIENASD